MPATGITIFAALASMTLLIACSQGDVTLRNGVRGAPTPQSVMVAVAKSMQSCWFGKKDPSFRKFKMATELDSFSGKPRVLIVPINKPTDLPKLVVQAQRIGGRNQVTSFGPLLQTADGSRIKRDVDRWARGQTSCA